MMKLSTLVEVVSAAHLSYLVNAPKEFSSRGGIMFVAPVGQFKTAITKTLDAYQPQALVLSDLTIRQLVEMRSEIAAGKIRTMAFTEFPKLYSRNRETAANLEGALHQMADEGFRLANYEEQRLIVKESRCFVVGAMPTDFYARKFSEWIKSGFARRFLWCHFQLADSEVIMRAIRSWMPIDFGKLIFVFPAAGGSIPFDVTTSESMVIEEMLRHSAVGIEAIPYSLLKKICSVLKWRYSELGKKPAAQKAMEILHDFSGSLKNVVELEIPFAEPAPEKKPAASKRA